jgi:hypothetical protein
MTTIGQSKTLANFMLEAKDWIARQASQLGKSKVDDSQNP